MTEPTNGRLSDGYQPDWDIDLSIGKAGERKVLAIADAWTEGRVEVKTDTRAATTGNLYVEFECKGRASGINTTKADAWAFVVGEVIIIIPTKALRAATSNMRWVAMNRGSHPTRGYLVPLKGIAELFTA